MLAPKAEAPPAPSLAPADLTAAPATATATTAAGSANESEGRYVIIDGKPQLVQGPPPATMPSDMNGAAPTTQGFAFNDLKEPSDKRVIRIPIGGAEAG